MADLGIQHGIETSATHNVNENVFDFLDPRAEPDPDRGGPLAWIGQFGEERLAECLAFLREGDVLTD